MAVVASEAVELDARRLEDWAHAAPDGLEDSRVLIDSLNVFPVPDGDTGTNAFLTMEAACSAMQGTGMRESRGALAGALARGALLGARGNSGVILSQILKGAADVIAGLDEHARADGAVLAAALHRGADLAYAAVARPVEGTILSVARAAADAAQARVDAGVSDAAEVIAAAAIGAREMLARTPEMLDSLRQAGVVDAGGQVLVVVLDALSDVLRGVRSPRHVRERVVVAPVERAEAGYVGPQYEVMYLLDAEDSSMPILRAELDALGDSLVVVGGNGLWNIHVHVDDAGAAVEAGMRAGHPHRIRITYLSTHDDTSHSGERALVAVTYGAGMHELMANEGVRCVQAVDGRRPSTAEILAAVMDTHAGEVIVLPGDSDTKAVSEIAADQARLEGVRVAVVPTRSVVQTLAAVAVHDSGSRFDDDVVAMTRAAGATRYGAVTTSVRDAITSVGRCAPGDILGLIDGDIRIIGRREDDTARQLLQAMLAAGGELVTLVLGIDAGPYLRDRLPVWLAKEYPLTDVVIHEGGQRTWPLIVGVE